jgi:hypothetical protein
MGQLRGQSSVYAISSGALKNIAFWEVRPCNPIEMYKCFEEYTASIFMVPARSCLYSEDGSGTFLRDFGELYQTKRNCSRRCLLPQPPSRYKWRPDEKPEVRYRSGEVKSPCDSTRKKKCFNILKLCRLLTMCFMRFSQYVYMRLFL